MTLYSMYNDKKIYTFVNFVRIIDSERQYENVVTFIFIVLEVLTILEKILFLGICVAIQIDTFHRKRPY